MQVLVAGEHQVVGGSEPMSTVRIFSTSIFFTRSIGDGKRQADARPKREAVAAEAGDDAARSPGATT